MFYVRLFLIPYLATVLAEEFISLLWGYRSRKQILTVLWVNALTNLPVTALRYLSGQWIGSGTLRTGILIFLEAAVVLAEWCLFKKHMGKGQYFLLFSLVMNAGSFGAGLLIPVILQLIHTGTR
ncbi:MAG: hypothetical protein IJ106_03645 [Parasporobacterium sp.]|nr:hypothetical protein [Parasporobacterium sp.]